MKRKEFKAAACALVGVLVISGTDISTHATQVSSLLPAAGVELALDEGMSVEELEKSILETETSIDSAAAQPVPGIPEEAVQPVMNLIPENGLEGADAALPTAEAVMPAADGTHRMETDAGAYARGAEIPLSGMSEATDTPSPDGADAGSTPPAQEDSATVSTPAVTPNGSEAVSTPAVTPNGSEAVSTPAVTPNGSAAVSTPAVTPTVSAAPTGAAGNIGAASSGIAAAAGAGIAAESGSSAQEKGSQTAPPDTDRTQSGAGNTQIGEDGTASGDSAQGASDGKDAQDSAGDQAQDGSDSGNADEGTGDAGEDTDAQDGDADENADVQDGDADENADVQDGDADENTDAQNADTGDGDGADEEEDYGGLVIAQVNDWVNVRSGPSTDSEILGKLYNDSVGEMIRQEGDWYYIASGTVTGYVKAEYCVAGEEAEAMVDEVSIQIATITTETLKLRADASTESRVLQLLPYGDELEVLESDHGSGWVKVNVNGTEGYVSSDYVTVAVNFVSAESKEEEEARLAREREEREEAERRAAELAAQEAAAAQPTESTEVVTTPDAQIPAASSSGSGLGTDVANYALQFVGNPYVYGGTSLTNGADCSGFVLAVYAQFGVSLPHSATADRSMGSAVGSLAEAQPGDLVCYSGHVGIYIGNGQIVHASTPRSGIKISNATYKPIACIRRIF